VRVRERILKRYRNVAWERCEQAAAEVLQSSDEDLFEWTPMATQGSSKE
jgi:hypothetical protein